MIFLEKIIALLIIIKKFDNQLKNYKRRKKGLAMQMFIKIHMIKIIMIFTLFLPSLSEAAITDCSQLSSDGQRDCIAPTTTYTGVFGGKYSSLDDIIQAYKEIQCNSLPGFSQCSLKTTSVYQTPTTCSQTNNCNLYTRVLGAPGNYAQVVVEKFRDSSQTWAVDSRGLVNKSDSCPIGYTRVIVNINEQTSLCKPPQSTRSVFCEDCVNSELGQSQIAHPVNLNSGIMSHIEHDYQGNHLAINRFYNSVSNNWFFSFSRKISYNSVLLNNVQNEFLTLTRDNGISIVFKKNPTTSNWENITPNTNGIVYDVNLSGNNNITLFKYLNENNELESYDLSGRLVEIKSLSGQKINLSYISDNSGTVPVLYTRISDDFNHSLQYKFLPNNNCQTSIVNAKLFEKINNVDVEKLNYDYGYNTSCKNNLVTYPNNLTNSYTYTSNNRLNSIIDENNQVRVKWTYVFNTARNQYVVSTTGLTSTGNINKNTLTYNTTANNNFVNKTNGLNQVTGINQQDNNGSLSTTDYNTGICSDCIGFQGKNTQYDGRGNIISYQDFNNNLYQLTYDNQSRLLQQKSAVGTTIENTTNYTWHLNTRLPETIQIPVSGGIKTTQFIYDDVFETINNKNILVKSQLKQINISAPDNLNSTIITKTSKYDYNSLNQLTRIENPRFVQSNGLINDIITFTYENNQLKTSTNGKGQITTYDNYNAYDQPGTVTYADGTKNNLTYDTLDGGDNCFTARKKIINYCVGVSNEK